MKGNHSGKGVKSVHYGEGFLVKRLSSLPESFSERPEVCISEVFHKDETSG